MEKTPKSKKVVLYRKTTKFDLIGKQEDLQKLMHDVHQFIGGHELMVGGLAKRRIDIKHKSTKPVKFAEINYN